MDILAVTHYMYLEMNIETFFELKWAFFTALIILP